MSKKKHGKPAAAAAVVTAAAPLATGPLARLWARRPVRLAVIVVGSILLAYGLLAGSSLLPSGRINGQVGQDIDLLTAETLYPNQSFLGSEYKRDNYTDALMMNISMIDENGPVNSTIRARHYTPDANNPVGSLAARVEAGPGVELTHSYIRYWQGYVSVLRPAFLLVTYSGWRIANALVLLALMVGCVVQIGRRVSWGSAVVFALTMVAVAPPVIFSSLQFSTVYYLALLGVLAVLYLADRYPYHRWDIELFLGLGIATAFFDFLTAPVLTLGIPFAVLLARRLATGSADRDSAESDGGGAWMPAVRTIPAWGIGYVGFWAVRWVTNAIFIDPNALNDIMGAIAQRSGSAAEAAMAIGDRFTVIGLNVSQLLPHGLMPVDQTTFLAAADGGKSALFTIAFLVLAAWVGLGALSGSLRWSAARSWPLLIVAALPIWWTLFAANHSLNHYFFTFRNMSLLVLGFGLLLVHGVYWDGVRARFAPAPPTPASKKKRR